MKLNEIKIGEEYCCKDPYLPSWDFLFRGRAIAIEKPTVVYERNRKIRVVVLDPWQTDLPAGGEVLVGPVRVRGPWSNYQDQYDAEKRREIETEQSKQFQVDGGEYVATLKEALEKAEYKVSFTLPSGERMRLVRWDMVREPAPWQYEPFEDELREALRGQGLPEDKFKELFPDD